MVSTSSPRTAIAVLEQSRVNTKLFLSRVVPVLKARSSRLAHGDRDLSHDLLQEGIIAAITAVEEYVPGVGTVDGFAAFCGTNRMIDVRRSHHVRTFRHEPLVQEDSPEAKVPDEIIDVDAHERLVDETDAASLRELLPLVLTAREQLVIERIYFASMSSKEAAVAMGISGARVTQLERAALQKLHIALVAPLHPQN